MVGYALFNMSKEKCIDTPAGQEVNHPTQLLDEAESPKSPPPIPNHSMMAFLKANTPTRKRGQETELPDTPTKRARSHSFIMLSEQGISPLRSFTFSEENEIAQIPIDDCPSTLTPATPNKESESLKQGQAVSSPLSSIPTSPPRQTHPPILILGDSHAVGMINRGNHILRHGKSGVRNSAVRWAFGQNFINFSISGAGVHHLRAALRTGDFRQYRTQDSRDWDVYGDCEEKFLNKGVTMPEKGTKLSRILIHIGTNDIMHGYTGEEVYERILLLVEDVHQSFPEVPVFVAALPPRCDDRPGFARCNHEEAIRRIRRQRYANDRLKASREDLIFLNQPETLNSMLEGYPSKDEVNKFLFDWCHLSDTAILVVLYHIIENPQWAAIDKW